MPMSNWWSGDNIISESEMDSKLRNLDWISRALFSSSKQLRISVSNARFPENSLYKSNIRHPSSTKYIIWKIEISVETVSWYCTQLIQKLSLTTLKNSEDEHRLTITWKPGWGQTWTLPPSSVCTRIPVKSSTWGSYWLRNLIISLRQRFPTSHWKKKEIIVAKIYKIKQKKQ